LRLHWAKIKELYERRIRTLDIPEKGKGQLLDKRLLNDALEGAPSLRTFFEKGFEVSLQVLAMNGLAGRGVEIVKGDVVFYKWRAGMKGELKKIRRKGNTCIVQENEGGKVSKKWRETSGEDERICSRRKVQLSVGNLIGLRLERNSGSRAGKKIKYGQGMTRRGAKCNSEGMRKNTYNGCFH